jgi:hypothetical protein
MNKITNSSLQHIIEEAKKSFDVINTSTLHQAVEAASINRRIIQQLIELSHINFSISIPKAYTDLIDTSTLMSAFEASREIARFAQSISDWQETYIREIVDLTRGLDTISRQLAADLAALRLAFREIATSSIISDLVKTWRENKEAVEAFRAAGWLITPSMPKQLKERVVNLHKQGKSRYATQTILGYYRRDNHYNLRHTVESWKEHPLFAPRMHIIQSALDAHCDGSYTLSIPALLPVVEGILNEYVRINNLTARFGSIHQVYNTVLEAQDRYSLATQAIVNTLLYLLRSNIYLFTDFENELGKSIQNRKTTRHTVLHGIDVNYDKPSNSLRVFLVLDALTALKNVYRENEAN